MGESKLRRQAASPDAASFKVRVSGRVTRHHSEIFLLLFALIEKPRRRRGGAFFYYGGIAGRSWIGPYEELVNIIP